MLCQRILKTYGDDPFKDVVVVGVNQTTEVSNEFLSTIFQKDSPETGYEKLHFNNFEGLETPLEERVIQLGKEKLTHVLDFKVSTMQDLPTEIRCQLIDFATDVIEQH